MDKAALVADPGAAAAATAAGGSFSSLRAYGRALAQTPRRVARRACAATAAGEEMSRVRVRSGARMAPGSSCPTPLPASARSSPPSATPSSPSTCPSPAAPSATSASPSVSSRRS
ncbi:unnamed protein product [Urochloa humidicola]